MLEEATMLLGPVSVHIGSDRWFLCVLTPLAFMARLFGKDWLKTKRDLLATTYWRPAKPESQVNREF
jgi:hypothetical protein